MLISDIKWGGTLRDKTIKTVQYKTKRAIGRVDMSVFIAVAHKKWLN